MAHTAGAALRTVVCDQGLEGVVAKRLDSTYRPGERGGWVKTKNRDYWRHGLKLEAIRPRHERARLPDCGWRHTRPPDAHPGEASAPNGRHRLGAPEAPGVRRGCSRQPARGNQKRPLACRLPYDV
jgi:hypothetical protein